MNTPEPRVASDTVPEQSLAEERADDFAYRAVPADMRIGRGKLHMASWCMVTGMVYLFYGALAATLAGTREALIGLVISALVLAAVNIPLVRLAVKTGMSNALVSRRMFGRVGELLIALLMAAAPVYFAVFESSVVAVTFQEYWGGNLKLWYFIVVAAMLPLMLGGVLTWLDKVNGYLLPLYAIGLIAAVVVAAAKGHGAAWLDYSGAVPPEARLIPGWLTTVVLYLGVWLIMPTSVDFARFAQRKDRRYHENVTFGWVFALVAFALNGAVGIFLVQAFLPGSAATAETGVVTALVGFLGIAGVVFIVVTQVRINTLNFYLASMNIQRLVHQLSPLRLSRKLVVPAVAVLVVLLMLTDVFSYLQAALQWQGIFFVGWVGILVTQLVVGGWRTAPTAGTAGGTGGLGMAMITPAAVVWLGSTAVGIVLLETPGVWPRLAQLAPIVSLALSVIGYLPIALRRRAAAGIPVEPEPDLVEGASAS